MCPPLLSLLVYVVPYLCRQSDPQYSNTLLEHAKELYAFGSKYRGKYSDSIPDADGFYKSSSYEDDLAWGALWIYLATMDNVYLREAEAHIKPLLDGG